MENKLSSISQLPDADELLSNDYFLVSQANQFSSTGYRSKKIDFAKFQSYLSALVMQDLTNRISNISGNVTVYQNVVNNVNGILNQNLNTYISQVEGNVEVTQNLSNYVEGELNLAIETILDNIVGNVDFTTSLQTLIQAEVANVRTDIANQFANIIGDVTNNDTIQNQITALTAMVQNQISTQIQDIVGNVTNSNNIFNRVSAWYAEISNIINSFVHGISGNYTEENTIINEVSSNTTNITNIINDLDAIYDATHYPVINWNKDADTDALIKLKDKYVNVVYMNGTDLTIQLESIPNMEHMDMMGKYYTRDVEMLLRVNSPAQITWDWDDSNVTEVLSPEDESILSEFDENATYLYYISEIDQGTLYINRHRLEAIR